jgi:dihydroxyacetone kinase
MAGCSLTICWLDDELERLWLEPALAPAFRRGSAGPSVTTGTGLARADGPAPAPGGWPAASGESRRSAACIAGLLRAALPDLAGQEEELGRLDARGGDGDHGQAMVRGLTAAAAAAEDAAADGAGARSTLQAAAAAWAERAGGTSGALWGKALSAWGSVLTDTHPLTPETVSAGAQDALQAVAVAGGAQPGDKTMIDAMGPFAAELADAIAAGLTLATAWSKAAGQASRAALETSDLVPRRGRARLHESRSAGHPDPGAMSFALLVTSAAGYLAAGGTP